MKSIDTIPLGIKENEFNELSASKDFKGLYIRLSPHFDNSRSEKTLEIEGVCGVFVNAGAAMSMWEQFPKKVIFHVKDLKNSRQYETEFHELSISWEGSVDFGPSNQLVQKPFNRNLFEVNQFKDIESLVELIKPGTSVEIYATFEGMTSNIITVELK